MSRSNKSQSTKKAQISNEDTPKKKYWIGYDVEPVRVSRQSKYSKGMQVFKTVIEVEEADYKYNSWDLDQPETH